MRVLLEMALRNMAVFRSDPLRLNGLTVICAKSFRNATVHRGGGLTLPATLAEP
jgi:hypothetical protein